MSSHSLRRLYLMAAAVLLAVAAAASVQAFMAARRQPLAFDDAYIGERASEANIIDIAGLNDTEIALHGFDMAAFLQRRPDIIWMPHIEYTWQRPHVL